jgi:Glycosyl transferase family 11
MTTSTAAMRAQIVTEGGGYDPSVIRVHTDGRMGNQMFQLAFAHAAAARLGSTYVYGRPPFKGKVLGPPLWRLFDVGEWGNPALRMSRYARFLARYGPRAPVVVVEHDTEPRAFMETLRHGVVYAGFYQSEQWFEGHEQRVREMFTPLPRERARYEARYGERSRPYICMHVRRGDYLETGGWALPTSWFLAALEAVPDRERYDVVVVSDDPVGVREELREAGDLQCEPNSMMVDLQLLMDADVVITSNSSFSWWGAWLNRRGAHVIAPQHWLGFAAGVEEPRGAIPDRWQQLPVLDAPLVRQSGGRRRGPPTSAARQPR